ncbi:MAG: nucleotidyltransferase [Bacteroidetes bacterium]|nr:nucleotidyltransferase [Bacteroidota bacterium]
MLNIPKDFIEFIELLNKHNVRYLIVGGYAVAYHGHPRSTGDIDILLECSHENAAVVKECLNKFGFGELDISISDLSTPNQVVQLGYPPLRIDLLTSIDGLNFQQAWKHRVCVDIQDMTINFISRNDLLTNKRATARTRDIADIEELT